MWCNDCHNLLQKAISFNEVATVSTKVSSQRIEFWDMSKDEVYLSKKIDQWK